MIDHRAIEVTIVNGLQEWLSKKGYNCPVIMANQAVPIPPYPYIAYTVTSLVSGNMKTYGIEQDGTRAKPVVQIWSFTVQSADSTEADMVAMEAYDWFMLSGNVYLSDNGIVAQRVGGITNRDNLLSIEYEYRRGFDVEFLLVDEISQEDAEQAGYIEDEIFNYKEEE